MSKPYLDLDRIIEQVRGKNSRFGIPLRTFIEEYARIDDVLIRSERKFREHSLKIWIRKAAIIGMVTAFEVYFKDMLHYLAIRRRKLRNIVDENDVISFKDLLDKRVKTFTVKQLMIYSIFQKYGFLNLDNIDLAFSRALKIKFFELLKSKAVRISKTGAITVIPYSEIKADDFYVPLDFHPRIQKIIRIRHTYAHDINRKTRPSFETVSKEMDEIFSFVFLIDLLINNNKF